MINYSNGRKYVSTVTAPKQPKKNKYSAVKTEVDNITFDSKKEARRYKELRLLEKVGEISNLRLQVPYPLISKSKYGREFKYIADFVYTDKSGNVIVEDTKGYRTDVYKIKRRMMAEKYGIKIKET